MNKDIPRNEILVGDAKEKLEELPDNSVDTAMTSPPYWALRDYGEDGQLGLEDTPEEYVENLMKVFDELQRVLKPTGTFYLNIDDTYSGGGGVQGIPEDYDSISTQQREKYSSYKPSRNMDLPDKCMSMIPERVMMAMVDNGWILRNKVVWRKKGGGMPESVKDRFSTTWEYVYMFSLNQHYYFDLDAVREPHESNNLSRKINSDKIMGDGGRPEHVNSELRDREKIDSHPKGKNPGDMWTIATAQMSEAHFAVYPAELCEKPVKAGCPKKVCANCGKAYDRVTEEKVVEERKPENGKRKSTNSDYFIESDRKSNQGLRDGYKQKVYESKGFQKQCDCDTDEVEKGTILDPFAGAGTTCLAARQHNRNYIGIELNEEYAEMARQRIKDEVGGVSLDNFTKSKQSSLDSVK